MYCEDPYRPAQLDVRMYKKSILQSSAFPPWVRVSSSLSSASANRCFFSCFLRWISSFFSIFSSSVIAVKVSEAPKRLDISRSSYNLPIHNDVLLYRFLVVLRNGHLSLSQCLHMNTIPKNTQTTNLFVRDNHVAVVTLHTSSNHTTHNSNSA